MRQRSVLLLLLCVCWLIAGLAPVWAQGRTRPNDGAASRDVAIVISVDGATSVRRAGATALVPAVRTLSLATGDTLVTGSSGRASLLFPNGLETKLNENTTLLVQALAPAGAVPLRLLLTRGEIFARSSPGQRLSIETPAAVAGVRGTELNLVVAEDGSATLTVGEGEVSFTNGQGRVAVRTSQQSVARPGQAPTLPVVVNAPFILQWTNDVQPVALLLETVFVSQDPARLEAALREAGALPPGPERSRRLGDVRHDQGELVEARAAYEGAQMELGPEAPATERGLVEARLGQTWLELGKLPEAEAAFRRSLALDPGATAARAGLVLSLLSRRLNQEALSEARAGVERAKRSTVAHTALALAQIRSGERDAAGQSLEQAVALAGDYAPAQAWRSFLLRAGGRLEEANEAARRAVALTPFSSLARQALSDVAFALGRVQEARAEGERAVAMNPLSPGAHVSLGRALLQAQQIDRAVREGNKAVALDPNLDRARFFLGVVLAEQRRLDRAAIELRRAVELDPGYLEARAFLARVYLVQGRQSEAVAVVQAATTRDPNFAPARAALGRVYWQTGRLKEAVAEYRAALALAPGSVLYHLELARVYLDRNSLPEALKEGLAAVSAAPGSSEAHGLVGLIYDRMSNREQALREFRTALTLSPDNALAGVGFGIVTINPVFGASLTEIAQAAAQAPTDDGLRALAQAGLRDPSALSRIFKPGVTAEIAPTVGSDESRSLQFTHRDQFFRGKLHDIILASQQWFDNYRNGRQEKARLAVANLVAAPNYRTHLLGFFLHNARQDALPGGTFAPEPDDRRDYRQNRLDFSTRYQVDQATAAWFRFGHGVTHGENRNPDAPADGSLRAFGRSRNTDLGIEGRLDHQWGNGHTLSYVLYAGREHLQARTRDYDPLRAAFEEIDFLRRRQTVEHTLQENYHPGSHLSLIVGVTKERFSQKSRYELASGQTLGPFDTAESSWLPFGQATHVLTRRDLIRVIVHKRRARGFNFVLRPVEAFLVDELPSAAEDASTTNYEFDYERRFSPRSFAKLFLFRSDVEGFEVAPAVGQTLESVSFTVPKARVDGIGLRYERQIGHFLSSYLRYTYSEATDKTERSTRGRQLPLNPHSRAVLGLNYVDSAGTKVFADLNWQSQMFVDPIWSDREEFDPLAPRPKFPARLVVNLRWAKERTVRREWVFRINNLFDTETIHWPGFPAPGRSYQLEYHIRF
jgi:tetratricopeptide (TPR) repeat protein